LTASIYRASSAASGIGVEHQQSDTSELKNTPNAVDNPSIIDIAGDGAMLAIITDDASTDHSTR
jgi:hypothetical protein